MIKSENIISFTDNANLYEQILPDSSNAATSVTTTRLDRRDFNKAMISLNRSIPRRSVVYARCHISSILYTRPIAKEWLRDMSQWHVQVRQSTDSVHWLARRSCRVSYDLLSSSSYSQFSQMPTTCHTRDHLSPYSARCFYLPMQHKLLSNIYKSYCCWCWWWL